MKDIDTAGLLGPLAAAPGATFRVLEIGARDLDTTQILQAHFGDALQIDVTAGSSLALARLRRQADSRCRCAFTTCDPQDASSWPIGPYDLILLPADSAAVPLDRLSPTGQIWRCDVSGALQPEARPDPVTDAFALTDIQHAYWLGRGATYSVGGVACHVYFEWELDTLDPERLETAWNQLIARHGMLRAVMTSDGMQKILPQVPQYTIFCDDLVAMGEDAAQARRIKTRTAMSDQVLDAEQWPLFDMRLTRLPSRKWCLHLDLDLLIVDVQSFHILLSELELLYRKPDTVLDPIQISFPAYLKQLANERNTPQYQQDRDWWLDRIDTLPPAPRLPLAGNPDAIQDPSFTRLQRRLPPKQWTRLETRAQDHGITKSALLLSAFGQVLARWSESGEFTLNLTQFDRRPLHSDVRYLVGDFTSVLLVALDCKAATGFLDHCERSHKALWQALTHSRFSGIQVLRERGHRHQGDGKAQMPVVFTSLLGLDIDALVHRDGGGVMLGEPCHLYTCTPQLWLDHQTMIRNGSLEYNWIVTDQVFPPGLAQAMFDAYGNVLDYLASDAADWSAPLPDRLLMPRQIQARDEVNSLTRPISQDRLEHGFWRACAATPDATALITADDSLSYAALAERVGAFGAALAAHTISPGEAIGVRFGKGVDQIAAVLAVLSAGGAYVPMANDLPAARVRLIAESCGMRFVLTDDPQTPDGLTVLTPADPVACPHDLHQTNPDDLAYIIYTSGSTGQPKGVRLTHRAAMNTILDINDRVALDAQDRVFGLSALSFDLSVYDIFGTFAAGAALVLPDPGDLRDPRAWTRQMQHSKVSLWNSVPALMQMLVEYLETTNETIPQSLRVALLSGDWIPVDLPDRLRGLVPDVKVAALGGATEAAIWSNWYEPAAAPAGWASIPYGYPLANQRYHVLDADMRPCPDWVEGDLYIAGAGLADGYQNQPDLSAAAFFRHPESGETLYATGDRARYRPGAILEFLGRRDGQIKLNGFRIETDEIASQMRAHPDIADAVLGLVESNAGNHLAAWVVLDNHADSLVASMSLPPDLANTRWQQAIAAGGMAAEVEIDPKALAQLREFDQLGEDAAVLAILRCLTTLDLVVDNRIDLPVTAVVSEDYLGLLMNWFRLLEQQGWCRITSGAVHLLRSLPDCDDLSQALATRLQQMRDVSGWNDAGSVLCDWIASCIDNLPLILRGSSHDALQILFPDGDIDRAESLYQDNLLAAHFGRTAAAVAANALGDAAQVIELGAGIGGMTTYALAALDPLVSRYVHSDISPHFKNVARAKFGAYRSLETCLYDINLSPEQSADHLHGYDVVLAGNVLHNATDVPSSLRHIRRLLKPGGLLILCEATRNNALQLVTAGLSEVQHEEFKDSRRDSGLPMLGLTDWQQHLTAAGYLKTAAWPSCDSVLAGLGQGVIVAQAPLVQRQFDHDAAHAYLAQHLPAYMLPSHYVCIDQVPLSANGKVDRSGLPPVQAVALGAKARTRTPPKPGIETELAAIWSDLLEHAEIAREDDFFALGGDSLLATRLGALLRTRMQLDLPLRILFETSTLAEQAAILGTASPGLPAGQLRLADGSGPTLTLFHASDGYAMSYRALADQLSDLQLIGLDAPGTGSGSTPLENMADLIAAHRSVLPKPPTAKGHHLLGWSMGAHTAWEMARSLLDDGERVASITLIDPSPTAPFLDATRSEGHLLLTCAPPDHHSELLAQGLNAQTLDAMPEQARMTVWQDVLARLGLPASLIGDTDNLQRFLAVLQANLTAMVETPRQPIAGLTAATRVLVLTAAKRPAAWGPALASWQQAIPNSMHLAEIPTDHWGILGAPESAARIRAHIADAESCISPPP